MVEQKIRGRVEHVSGGHQTLNPVGGVVQVVERVGEQVPFRLRQLRSQRRRAVPQRLHGYRAGALRLALGVEDDHALGVHEVQDGQARGGFGGEHFPEALEGVDEQLDQAALDPYRLALGHAVVRHQYRHVDVARRRRTAGDGRSRYDRRQGVRNPLLNDPTHQFAYATIHR